MPDFAPVDEQMAIIARRTEEILPEAELRQKLEHSRTTGTPLRVKQGFDPTAPDIHLGHTIGLQKCAEFQELGHQVVLIVGDYTAQVGDPSGVAQTRRRLSADEVRGHAQTYLEQYGQVLDLDRTEVRWNGEWFGAMDFGAVMDLASQFTVAQVLEREDFDTRYKAGKPISIHEIFYILMQAWDSVKVQADVELGATEQKFNFLAARDLQKAHGQAPQVMITLPVLVGTDGTQRMSKSTGNYIGVSEPPNEQFGKVMSVPDAALPQWFELLSGLDAAAIAEWLAEGTNPRDAKAHLGTLIVDRFHGAGAGAAASDAFTQQFSKKQLPDDIPDVTLTERPATMADLLVAIECASSKSEARRLIAQGGVTRIRGEAHDRLDDAAAVPDVASGDIIKVGKRRYRRLSL
jgi:tyrosyl-tRNA synthetase